MGWQDREWAKWTDEERDRFLGRGGSPAAPSSSGRTGIRSPSELTLLAMAVSLACSYGFAHFHLLHLVRPAPVRLPSSPPPVVYGTGLAHSGSQAMTCTAMTQDDRGALHCTTWTMLLPGERTVQAQPLPAGTVCAAATADQTTGRWVCVAPQATT